MCKPFSMQIQFLQFWPLWILWNNFQSSRCIFVHPVLFHPIAMFFFLSSVLTVFICFISFPLKPCTLVRIVIFSLTCSFQLNSLQLARTNELSFFSQNDQIFFFSSYENFGLPSCKVVVPRLFGAKVLAVPSTAVFSAEGCKTLTNVS